MALQSAPSYAKVDPEQWIEAEPEVETADSPDAADRKDDAADWPVSAAPPVTEPVSEPEEESHNVIARKNSVEEDLRVRGPVGVGVDHPVVDDVGGGGGGGGLVVARGHVHVEGPPLLRDGMKIVQILKQNEPLVRERTQSHLMRGKRNLDGSEIAGEGRKSGPEVEEGTLSMEENVD